MNKLIWAAIISILTHGVLLGSNLQWLKKKPIAAFKNQRIIVNMSYREPVRSTNSTGAVQTKKKVPENSNPKIKRPAKPLLNDDRKRTDKKLTKIKKHSTLQPNIIPMASANRKPPFPAVAQSIPLIPKPETSRLEQTLEKISIEKLRMKSNHPVNDSVPVTKLPVIEQKVIIDLPKKNQQFITSGKNPEILLDTEENPVEVDQVDHLETTSSKPIVEAIPLYDINPPPRYPSMARRRGLTGAVILEVLVNLEGGVDELSVFKSSGHTILDKTALESVEQWSFKPGKRGGKAVSTYVRVPVYFKLN